MLIIFDSLTGQGERFASRLGYETLDIIDYDNEKGPLFLVTRSQGFGNMSEDTIAFLDSNAEKVVGVAVTGNRNWGDNFGAAGDKINDIYGIELVHKFESSGLNSDIAVVKEWINDYLQNN